MDKNIFISYIEEDKEVAELIWDRLTQEGFRPWAYTKNGSLNWKREIVKELKKSDIMILVFSKKADQKADKQIAKELGLASQYEKVIIPFMIDKVSPNDITNEAIAYEIIGGSRTWIEKEEPIEKQIDKLLNRIFNLFKDTANDNYLIGENFNFTTNESLSNKSNSRKLTPNLDDYIATLEVSNTRNSNSNWHSSVRINPADLLSFNLHYNTKYMGAKNVRVYIDNLHNMIFNSGSKVIVYGKISAENLDDALGKVEVFFDKKVRLVFHSISWQKWPCTSPKCETPIKGNTNDIFTKKGLLIGNILKNDDSHYSGNIVISYTAISIK